MQTLEPCWDVLMVASAHGQLCLYQTEVSQEYMLFFFPLTCCSNPEQESNTGVFASVELLLKLTSKEL